MFHLAGTDSECKCAKRTMSCCVAIAANNCHAGKRAALFWSDDMNDSLIWVTHGEQREAVLSCIVAKHLYLLCGNGICDWQMDISSWHVVVFCSNGEVGTAQWATSQTQTIKSLRACYFMNKVKVDVEQVCVAGGTVHDMLVPYFLREGHWIRHRGSFRNLNIWDTLPK
ncbi:unannotated protein [freshwater metagenome]|uniref:Unannotated protein n=1 Tax=freshwater metagenome TaxID=449393 RepID=A0A6J7SZF7_9ZZZZ